MPTGTGALRGKPASDSGGKEPGKLQSPFAGRAALGLLQGVCGAGKGIRPTGIPWDLTLLYSLLETPLPRPFLPKYQPGVRSQCLGIRAYEGRTPLTPSLLTKAFKNPPPQRLLQ